MQHPLGINIPQVINEQIVRDLPTWNIKTARLRALPSFCIAGVQKGGTTSLVQYLQAHPQLIQPQRKDVFYFNNLTRYKKGDTFYRAFFCLRLQQSLRWFFTGNDVQTFDGTPNYFDVSGAAQRIAKTLPQAKIVLLLRNPLKRAYSNYNMALKFGFETLPFYEALQAEEERVRWFEESIHYKGHNFVYQRLAYRKRGQYSDFLPEWIEVFGDNLHVEFTEDLNRHPEETYARILKFLHLKPHAIAFTHYNKGEYAKEMDQQSLIHLTEHYKPYNQKLATLLNRTVPW